MLHVGRACTLAETRLTRAACDLLREVDALRDELRLAHLHYRERLRERQVECQALYARARKAEGKEGGSDG